MTVQKSNSITLDEIVGFNVECRKCHVRTAIPFSAQGRFPSECSYCGDSWVVNGRKELHQKFLTSTLSLSNAIREMAAGTNNANCILSLEIKPTDSGN